jgi:CBS domain-containing protein
MHSAKEVMSKNPKIVSLHTSLKKACELMLKNDIGFLPVGDNKNIEGVVTDRDIVLGMAGGKDLSDEVDQVMTSKVITCSEDDNITKVAETMRSRQVHRVVVLDASRKIIGVLTLGDISRKENDEELSGHALSGIMKH